MKAWLDSTKVFIETNGYIYTSLGRKRRLKNVFSPDKGIASHEVRSGINASMQSVASDINLLAAIDMEDSIKRTGLRAEMFMLVHDAIVSIVHPEDVEEYTNTLAFNTQKDRGFSIPGCPIRVDSSVGMDYSFGGFDKSWGDQYGDFIRTKVPTI